MKEPNLDGLVAPVHNYAGLAPGNVASESNAGNVSNPRAAALQGLQKMCLLMEMGVPQMVMPPHPRPDTGFLQQMGFTGGIAQAAREAPEILPVCYSASGMWAANAATVTPSADNGDGRVHFTPANLICTAHRAVESSFSSRVLTRLFSDEKFFAHHAPLPANLLVADEGAANHMHLLCSGGGLHVFVYGRDSASLLQHTRRFPARQALQASRAVVRRHGLKRAFFVRQNPAAIDAGVFHNDVIATSNGNVLLYHELAFAEGDAPVEALQQAARGELCIIRISAAELPLEAVVQTYLFNSQIINIPQGGMVMIAPSECEHHPQARPVIDAIVASNTNPIQRVLYLDLRESMRNGGGPACLRLRVPLTDVELSRVHAGALLTPALHEKLVAWVKAHYRDRLRAEDLADPSLEEESRAALKKLEPILDLPGLYDLYE